MKKCSWLLFSGAILFSGASSLFAQSQHGIHLFSKLNYYTSESNVIIVSILSEEKNHDAYKVVLNDKTSQPITTIQLDSSRTLVSIPIENFEIGRNQIQANIFSGEELIDERIIEFEYLEPVSNEVKIDQETGGLIVDGLPFFPFGFYLGRVGEIPEREVVNGFNTIGPYQGNLPEGLEERKAYMDRAAELGIKVQYGLNSLIGTRHNSTEGPGMSEEEVWELLKSEVLAFRNHPALLSWYINDEPDGQGRPPELLEKAYDFIHELDPYHPISIVFMLPSKIGEFRNTMDIAMTDPYPIPNSSVDIQSYVKEIGDVLKYEKSVWLVPQAFGGQEMWNREPTASEIRVMTYLGIINNVKGIQYFIRSFNNLNPQAVSAWSETSNMAVEVTQMTPFLLSAEPSYWLETGDPDIFVRSFSHNGEKLLVAVNKSNTPKNYSIQLREPIPPGYRIDAWFENRRLEFEGNVLEDIIDGFGTRVYRIRKEDQNSTKMNSGNIVYNPSFEIVASPGLSAGHNLTFTSYEDADHGGTVFADSRQSVDGLFSMRMITPTDQAGKKVRFIPNILIKGNSYNVSIWAKAKQQANMPNFRIVINAANQEETFQLTSEWKLYSFAFTADSTSTNAIVELDMPNQGTAWFDLFQISPDPVIDYVINDDQTATVTISTSTPTADVRYSSMNSSSEGKALDYNQPFVIKRAATINAMLFEDGQKIIESKKFIPVNSALGKPVHFETPYNSKYTAQGDSSLTNGVMGSTSFRDGNWLGYLDDEVTFTVDMQEIADVNSVMLNFLCDPNSGIFIPDEVKVYTSLDGDSYTLSGERKNNAISKRGEPYLVPFEVELEPAKARFIKFTVSTFGEIPDGYLFTGTHSWMFMDEVLVE
ncbi:carbohydrate binding domain-containing protein [Rhodohalobacter sp. 614A]|uniref:carbohydrate binding domain-containing protein n=1 Tax=Rhodohalobacter sp. 614A TaxID=2908649 RepID=UPI001F333617|nr:carbohydrate binding domain-containing protein [Rhodohalobacter sp. 614A]